ncbi:MAG: hypothetical protein O3C40_21560 [Planctomycetota bacterium]|nr:hypothetical protein [Planctomycetota bacterium]
MMNSPRGDAAPTSYQSNGRKRENVLVVFYSNGFAERYAGKAVDIHIAAKPLASSGGDPDWWPHAD